MPPTAPLCTPRTRAKSHGHCRRSQSLLRLAIGARIAITHNDSKFAHLGIVNGALGTVVGLEYPAGVTPQVGRGFREAMAMRKLPILPTVLVQREPFPSVRPGMQA
jgi:hypothetical protein